MHDKFFLVDFDSPSDFISTGWRRWYKQCIQVVQVVQLQQDATSWYFMFILYQSSLNNTI